MIRKNVIVIGGGPAGLMAAGQAALAGADVTLLEKMSHTGRKLSITGKGRCNLTNIADVNDFIDHFGRNGRFLRQAFARYFSDDLMTFLGHQGISVTVERGGRVFPDDNDAPAVAKALHTWAVEAGVKIITNARVSQLMVQDKHITGVSAAGREYAADAVIMTTGGASYPATGSSGDGYTLAAEVGHTLIAPRPALVPLVTRGGVAQSLQGLSLKNVAVKIMAGRRTIGEQFGEMLFTHYGLSGPIILSLSRLVVDALADGQPIIVKIDLKPALSPEKLDARLQRDIQAHGKQHFKTVLKGLLPATLIPVCCRLTGIDEDKPVNQVTAAERRRLGQWLKDFQLMVTGARSYDEAIVTAGGIDLREVDPRTMMSKIVDGLYFAGELLDIDGDTGGYNLQAAFSTGWLAGTSAAT